MNTALKEFNKLLHSYKHFKAPVSLKMVYFFSVNKIVLVIALNLVFFDSCRSLPIISSNRIDPKTAPNSYSKNVIRDKRDAEITTNYLPVTIPHPLGIKCTPSKSKIEELFNAISDDIIPNIINLSEYIEDRQITNDTDIILDDVEKTKCEQMENVLNSILPTKTGVLCPLQYKCDHDERRYPPYIVSPQCLEGGRCSSCINYGTCSPTYVTIKVLKLSRDTICDGMTQDDSDWIIDDYKLHYDCKCQSS
jgi:hypothetical protein